MPKTQHYGIHFPFTRESHENTFVDLDADPQKAMQSDIMHIIFTPKGQRIRNPEFGTDLIKYIFSPNDSNPWSEVRNEIKNAVSKYVPNVTLNDINIFVNDGVGHGITAEIKYTVDEGAFSSQTYTITTTI